MALQSSGAISLNDVNVELGNSGNASINMGSTAVRDLFGVASGAISLSDGYGAASVSAVNPLTLSQTYKLCGSTYAANAGPTGPYDNGPEFGYSVAISQNENYYIVGARNTTPNQGSFNVFNSSGVQQYLVNSAYTRMTGGAVTLTNNYAVAVKRYDSGFMTINVFNISNGTFVRTIPTTVLKSSNLSIWPTVKVRGDTDIVYIRYANRVEAYNVATGASVGGFTTTVNSVSDRQMSMALTENYVFVTNYDGAVQKLDLNLNLVATLSGVISKGAITATEGTIGLKDYAGSYKIYNHSGVLVSTVAITSRSRTHVDSSSSHHFVLETDLGVASELTMIDDSGTVVRTLTQANDIPMGTSRVAVGATSIMIGTFNGQTSPCTSSWGTLTGEAQIWKE
jgi:hypothetical protein